jgi:type I restriction enzyme, S subunit
MSFPRYPAYKPSGVVWLGEVPEHWQEKPLKTITSINDEVLPESLSPDHEIEYVDIGSVSLANGIEKTEAMPFGDAPSRARRIPRDGDVLVSTVRTYLKAIAPVVNPPSNLVASTGFAVVRPRHGLETGFLKYALQEEHFIQQVISRSTGVSYPAINASDVAKISLNLPGSSEQLAIATFLDHETTKIDALIAEQQRLIELLQEKRQAVISHAVTKGLNPHAPMKDSGVEWLGEVPEHWSTTALKRIVSVCGRIGFRGYTTEDLVPEGEGALVLGGANLTSEGRLDLSKQTFISWHKYEESPEIKVTINDLVIGQRGTCGKVVMIDHDIGPATINPSLVLLRRPTVDSEFLCYWLMGELVQSIFESFLNATAVPMLSQQQIGNVRVIYPPLDEQRAIVSFVTAETAGLDTLTAEAKCAIALLQERRSALIFAGVTGQIDVRCFVDVKGAAS